MSGRKLPTANNSQQIPGRREAILSPWRGLLRSWTRIWQNRQILSFWSSRWHFLDVLDEVLEESWRGPGEVKSRPPGPEKKVKKNRKKTEKKPKKSTLENTEKVFFKHQKKVVFLKHPSTFPAGYGGQNPGSSAKRRCGYQNKKRVLLVNVP